MAMPRRFGECLHRLDRRIFRKRMREGEERLVLDSAEIRPGKELGRKHDLRARLCRLLDQRGDGIDVGLRIGRMERQLQCS